MGISILELVIKRLREEQFAADIAYPGQKFPQITKPAAAVHIEKVDRAGMTVTVEVTIICPASLGGTTCELEALRATETLRWSGAVCVQNGCIYDGVAQVYTVQILATFTGVTEADSYTMGPGFRVFLNDVMQMDAVAVSEEEIFPAQLEYVMGETAPVGITAGSRQWSIQLEELIPAGSGEMPEVQGEFTMTIVMDNKTARFTGCRWTSTQRKFAQGGLRRIRKGFALMREEEANG